MNALIKKAVIISAASPFHLSTKDILITAGIIKEISDNIPPPGDTEIIFGDGLHVSVGWMDIFADFGEPGGEHRETFETGAAAAAAGGFTDVMLIPNTNPAIYSKSQVESIAQRAKILAVNIHPIGAVTKNTDGNELAEMYDMADGGAVAFSDGTHSIQQPGMLLKALQYLSADKKVLIQLPDDTSLSAGGLINEGIVSTRSGLPGSPAIAEEIMVARDLSLLEYTESSLHITGVSSKKSLALINEAKEKGMNVTCSVTPYHLFFCDEDTEAYDTNLKVNPPLRTRRDMEALQAALHAGTIDCIASHHSPQCADDKACEFEYAHNGMITLQTLFGTVNGMIRDSSKVIELLTAGPRNIFNIPLPEIKEDARASLTLFQPDSDFIFEESMIKSKSKNSPFIGKKMSGKIVGIINNNKMVLND